MLGPNDSLYSLSEIPEIGVPGAVAEHTADISDQCQDRGQDKSTKATGEADAPMHCYSTLLYLIVSYILENHMSTRHTSQRSNLFS